MFNFIINQVNINWDKIYHFYLENQENIHERSIYCQREYELPLGGGQFSNMSSELNKIVYWPSLPNNLIFWNIPWGNNQVGETVCIGMQS